MAGAGVRDDGGHLGRGRGDQLGALDPQAGGATPLHQRGQDGAVVVAWGEPDLHGLTAFGAPRERGDAGVEACLVQQIGRRRGTRRHRGHTEATTPW